MNRKVPYCSQACQLKDWENGHMEICGIEQPADHMDTKE